MTDTERNVQIEAGCGDGCGQEAPALTLGYLTQSTRTGFTSCAVTEHAGQVYLTMTSYTGETEDTTEWTDARTVKLSTDEATRLGDLLHAGAARSRDKVES